ncbi:MAG: hypothetical protein AAFY47_09295, partial [Pseudomonadota bacterium]
MSIFSKNLPWPSILPAAAIGVVAMVSPISASAQSTREDVKDVAQTPLEDVGLTKEEVAEILLAAAENPYETAGNGRCAALITEVERLNAVLGDDIDVKDEDSDDFDEKKIAKDVFGSFIPFRGLVREISGAAGDERKAEAAVRAGMVRRGYLKGLGQAKGCKYPGRPKT